MGLDLTGIIAGGIGGGAQAVQSMAQDQIATSNKADLFKQEQDAELAKLNAAEQFRTDLANQQRVTSSGLINARAQQIADTQQATSLNNFYNKPNSQGVQPTSVSALAPADISDEEKAMAPISSRDMQSARAQAGAELGYVSPTTDATTGANITRAEDILAGRNYAADTGSASRIAVGAGHDTAKVDSTKISTDGRSADAATRADAYDKRTAMLAPKDQVPARQVVPYDKDIDVESAAIGKIQSNMVTMNKDQQAAAQAEIETKKAQIADWRAKKYAILSANPRVAEAYDSTVGGGSNLSQTGASSIAAPTAFGATPPRADPRNPAGAYQAWKTSQGQ